MHMSVSEAKAKLTDLVKRAEAGEGVILTRHGKEVARLVALRAAPSSAARRTLIAQVRASAARRCTTGASAARSQGFSTATGCCPGDRRGYLCPDVSAARRAGRRRCRACPGTGPGAGDLRRDVGRDLCRRGRSRPHGGTGGSPPRPRHRRDGRDRRRCTPCRGRPWGLGQRPSPCRPDLPTIAWNGCPRSDGRRSRDGDASLEPPVLPAPAKCRGRRCRARWTNRMRTVMSAKGITFHRENAWHWHHPSNWTTT